MKRAITLFLLLIMLLSLCGCAETQSVDGGNTPVAGLQIGYSKINITPDFSVGLGGNSDMETRRSTGFADYIYITCIAATEGEETVLLYTVDNCSVSKAVVDQLRDAVTPATGISGDKIFVGATHSHSCPSLVWPDEAGNKFSAMVMEAAATAAKEALADRSAASMLVATPIIEGMNFVRHYKLSDGSYAGSNFGDFFGKTIEAHAAEPDRQMVLVKFDRGEKKSVLMVNWQAHPDSSAEIGYTTIAASWIGPLRDTLEAESGCHVAYFTGASGNTNMSSSIPELNHGLATWRDYGVKMGQLAAESLSQLQPVEGSGIQTTGTMLEVEVDHSWDPMLAQANEVYDLWKSMGKETGDAKGKEYDFSSVFQARAIRTRATMAATEQLEVNAFSIGGIGFTTGTYEMFSTSAMYVKEHSPFKATFIITGNNGYIPSAEAFDYRCYEADTGMYAKGVAEQLAENYVKMLKEIQ